MSDCVEAGKLAVACVRGVAKSCCHVVLQPVLLELKVTEAVAIASELATNLEILSRWSKRLWDLAESDTGRRFDVAAIQLPHDARFAPSAFGKAAWMARNFFLPVNLAIAEAADLVADSCYPESELMGRLRGSMINSPGVAEAFVIELDRRVRETEIQVDDAEVLVARIREEMAVLRCASFPQESNLPNTLPSLTKLEQRLWTAIRENLEPCGKQCKIDAVVLQVWEDEEKESTALRPALTRFNNKCIEHEIPVELRVDGRYLIVDYRT